MPSVTSAAPKQDTERHSQVQTLFTEIAPRYALLNHVLSRDPDRSWRSTATDRAGRRAAPD